MIFTSDNGPHNESHHNLARFNPSGPLTGIKRSLTDGGIRVPAIACWPGRIAAGRETDHVAYFGDWMATAAELAEAKTPAECDSISFDADVARPARVAAVTRVPLLGILGRGIQNRPHFIRAAGRESVVAARMSPVVLYDQRTDVSEETNVAAEHPEIGAKIGDLPIQLLRSESPGLASQRWETPSAGRPLISALLRP